MLKSRPSQSLAFNVFSTPGIQQSVLTQSEEDSLKFIHLVKMVREQFGPIPYPRSSIREMSSPTLRFTPLNLVRVTGESPPYLEAIKRIDLSPKHSLGWTNPNPDLQILCPKSTLRGRCTCATVRAGMLHIGFTTDQKSHSKTLVARHSTRHGRVTVLGNPSAV